MTPDGDRSLDLTEASIGLGPRPSDGRGVIFAGLYAQLAHLLIFAAGSHSVVAIVGGGFTGPGRSSVLLRVALAAKIVTRIWLVGKLVHFARDHHPPDWVRNLAVIVAVIGVPMIAGVWLVVDAQLRKDKPPREPTRVSVRRNLLVATLCAHLAHLFTIAGGAYVVPALLFGVSSKPLRPTGFLPRAILWIASVLIIGTRVWLARAIAAFARQERVPHLVRNVAIVASLFVIPFLGTVSVIADKKSRPDSDVHPRG